MMSAPRRRIVYYTHVMNTYENSTSVVRSLIHPRTTSPSRARPAQYEAYRYNAMIKFPRRNLARQS